MSSEPNFFIFGNKPHGEYEDSFWDTSTILEKKEYYFTSKDKLTYKPKKGDVVIFKEFNTKIYWGQAIIGDDKEEVEKEGNVVIRFKLKDIRLWLYNWIPMLFIIHFQTKTQEPELLA
jgi:hypothetical protein